MDKRNKSSNRIIIGRTLLEYWATGWLVPLEHAAQPQEDRLGLRLFLNLLFRLQFQRSVKELLLSALIGVVSHEHSLHLLTRVEHPHWALNLSSDRLLSPLCWLRSLKGRFIVLDGLAKVELSLKEFSIFDVFLCLFITVESHQNLLEALLCTSN